MTVRELYNVSPWAHMFIVDRGDDNELKIQLEYTGGSLYANRTITRVNATRYPMYDSVLEVEIDLWSRK